MLSAQNARSDHPTSLPPPSALLHVVREWSYGFYRTCLIRECIYKTVWLTVMNHRITNLRGWGESWEFRRKCKQWYGEAHHFSEEGCVLCWEFIKDGDGGTQRMTGLERHQEINEAGVCLSGFIWQKRRQQYFNGRFRANKKISFLTETDAEEKLPIWNMFFPLKEERIMQGPRKKACKQGNNESPSSKPSPLYTRKAYLWEGITPHLLYDLLHWPHSQCLGYEMGIRIPASQGCCSYDDPL